MTVLVRCRNAAESEVWGGPKRLAKAARQAGWWLRVTYAKAELTRKNGEVYVTESIAVRMRHTPLAAAAIWYDGKFDHAWVWSQYSEPKKIGARELAKFVKAAA